MNCNFVLSEISFLFFFSSLLFSMLKTDNKNRYVNENQAYDFLALNRKYGAVLQMGGSDQWGNIISGVELARKVDQVY